MPQGKRQAGKPGAAKERPDSPREDRRSRTSEGESNQPYASEVNDYHGGKVKPPKESPTTADG